MSLPKHRSLFEIYVIRKCQCKTIPSLNTEAKMAKEDFSTFLNTWFAKSLAHIMLRSVEDVILNIFNEMEFPYVINKIYDNNHLDNLSQIVQRLYTDLESMVKVEQHCQGNIQL
jgi:hypothetical protein